MPDLFAGPYIFLEPRLAFVLDDGELWEGLARYPAHLHIDLLPGFQGNGYGRKLIDTFGAAATEAGAAGMHVTVVTENTRALGFCERIGFTLLADGAPGPVTYLGRPL